MNVNTQIQSMLPDNNPIAGGYIKILGPSKYKYLSKDEFLLDIKASLPNNRTCCGNSQSVPVPSPCGCYEEPTPTPCIECGCIAPLPEYKEGTLVPVCDYSERVEADWSTDIIIIEQVRIDGVDVGPSDPIVNPQQLIEYFESILSENSTVAYTSGKIQITSDQELTIFNFTNNGEPNISIFNKTNCRTLNLGVNNRYIIEQNVNGNGDWIEFNGIAVTNATDIPFTSSTGILATNVGDALEAIQTEINNSVSLTPVEYPITTTANIPYNITHNLGRTAVIVQAYSVLTGEMVLLGVSNRTANTVTITSTTSEQFIIVIL